jgi:capsular exopolysaccharide synthesis family protein
MSTIFQALDTKTGLLAESVPLPAAPRADGAAPELPIRVLPIKLSGSSPLLPFDGSNEAAGEQYRVVRTNLLQHPDAPRVLVISSCGSGDGKTLSAVNTAGALAMKKETTVLLLDADLRNPTLARTLGLPHEPGLADVLSGKARLEEAIVQTAQFPNLYVLAAGKARRNPAELLDSNGWRQLCATAKNSFRFVLMDTPPIAAVADYDLVQAVADGVIFVARPDHSNRSLCLTALQKVQASGKLTGVLINCAENWFLFKRYGHYPYPYAYPYPAHSHIRG